MMLKIIQGLTIFALVMFHCLLCVLDYERSRSIPSDDIA